MTITSKKDGAIGIEFTFDNGSWVSLNEIYAHGCDYEFMLGDDEDTYFLGDIYFDTVNGERTVVDYDGCYELPIEVVIALNNLGIKTDEI